MEFEPKEIKQIEKYIYKLEKDSKRWLWERWFILIFSLLFIVASFCGFFYFAQCMEPFNSAFSLHEDSLDIEDQLLKLKIVLFELFIFVSLVFIGIFYVAVLVYTSNNWNKHIKLKIKASIIRKLIYE